uniref:Tegument protein UL14 n=1 Tax=Mastomys natalensis cytomegalovirus 1 TaxID=2973541 RepID=A0A9Y1IL81_9BETA|nr:tegument protein UL14 [Mastomys natalensis cytomegalovirus 1]WEG68954.1 tegument protein UL14 [Mastomys natalensis cytomegalovirus 1]WEG71182.1 tegument protein UL14 [Mastomys natalensis cytomegalovirus 1]
MTNNSKNGDNCVMKDALRAELENTQFKFFVQAFGNEHPLSRMQRVRLADARTRLVIREARRTAQDVAAAITARRLEMTDVASRNSISKDVDVLVDAVAEMKDEIEDFREVFTSSQCDE